MGKLWIPGSGSGAGSGSDECTASKSEELKGYSAVTSDSDDEPVQGTLELTGDASDGQVLSGKTYYNTDPKKKRTGSMANQGAVSVKLNAGEGYTIPSGFHNGGGKVEANGLASQTPGTATSAHILSGQSAWVNGNKVNGGIPLQNAEISGSDRAWALSMSNWAGTINLKVRNGHYLNGVNWIQQDIPEYQPWNIKKGVNIGGVIGTFEGYVPTAQDLYYRGSNPANMIHPSKYAGSITYDSGQITWNGGTGNCLVVITSDPVNLTPYSYINVELYKPSSGGKINLLLRSSIDGGTFDIIKNINDIASGNSVLSLDVSAINAYKYFEIQANSTGIFYIYRIWLS